VGRVEAGQVPVGVRAAAHALDAALAEHRRALAMAASRREQERMARGREVKAAARLSEEALEQPVQRPMRGVRLAETWIEIDHARHPLTAAVRAAVDAGELRVRGAGWSARLVLAPGEGPAAVAREAAAAIETAAAGAAIAARRRLARVTATAREHAAACFAAAEALAAADRDAAERHAERARLDACVAELASRLGPRRPDELPEIASARDRLEHARAHLATPPAQPCAWLEGWPPEVAGALLRDLPDERLAHARPAMRRLSIAAHGDESLLAIGMAAAGGDRLAAGEGAAIVAVTPARILVAADAVRALRPLDAGDHVFRGLEERRPGRLAAVLELLVQVDAGSALDG
jgi:hypothetical protein